MLGAKCSSCVLQQVGGAVKLMIVLMEGRSFPLDDCDGNWVDFGTGSKLFRDPLYCKGSTNVLEPAEAKRENVYCIE